MKKTSFLIHKAAPFCAVGVLAFVMLSAASAYAQQSCEVRRAAIMDALLQAEQHQHAQKAVGLRQALDELNAHCTQAGTLANTRQELAQLELKIRDKQQSIKTIQQEIDIARAEDDTKKVIKLERKLSHKNEELIEVKQKNNDVKAELTTLVN